MTRPAPQARRWLLQRRNAVLRLSRELLEDDLQLRRRSDGADILDQAALREPQPVLQSLRDSQREELAEIDAALRRIRAGVYGSCESCGRPIARQRLRAVPHARTCIDCTSVRRAVA